MLKKLLIGTGFLLLAQALPLSADNGNGGEETVYDLTYHVELVPKKDIARVSIEIPDARLLSELDFRIKPGIHNKVEANGKLKIKDNRAIWTPPAKKARFSLEAKLSHQRENKTYDALMTGDWAIFRGDDIIPAARVTAKKGAKSYARLVFDLPSGWRVNTGWERDKSRQKGDKNRPEFIVDNPERKFDRPTGWMIAGKLGTRRDQLGSTRVSISAPMGAEGLHRIEGLVFLGMIWPEMEEAFGPTPPKFLIVGGSDPMWRGGLSGPNSLFLHSERPLVSGNGTSSFVHELVHSFTRIQGDDNDDWIAEGIAEFYSFELLYRAGGITPERREKIIRSLADWGEDVRTLRKKSSTGPTTARATVLFDELDKEIRKESNDKKSLDDLTRELIDVRHVSLEDLREECRELIDRECKTLDSKLLD